jgi:hypothetical protein
VQYQSKTAKGHVMSAIYFIGGTAIACSFVGLGWGGDGYLFDICMLVGGLYFGHLITDALTGETK